MIIEDRYHPENMMYVLLVLIILFIIYHAICYLSKKKKSDDLYKKRRLMAYDGCTSNKSVKDKKLVNQNPMHDDENFDFIKELRN